MARVDDREPLVVLRTEDGHDADSDDLRAFLSKDEILGPYLRTREAPIPPDALGGAAGLVAVACEQGPLAAALATALVGYLKYRTSDISISIVRPDGTEVKAEVSRVRGRSAEDLEAALTEAVRAVCGPGSPPGPSGDA
jgi:hypothetical protein